MKLTLSFFFIFLFVLYPPIIQNQSYKIRTIAFYNVENLFDTINNPLTFDDDFTPGGKNNYTSIIYQKKINNIAKVISEIGVDKTKLPPTIIGLSEIENDDVIQSLIESKYLNKHSYQSIQFDSPDIRGIDVALIYNDKYFSPLEQKNNEIRIWDEEGKRILQEIF